MVQSRPTGSVRDCRRAHPTSASLATVRWPRDEWVEKQVRRGAYHPCGVDPHDILPGVDGPIPNEHIHGTPGHFFAVSRLTRTPWYAPFLFCNVLFVIRSEHVKGGSEGRRSIPLQKVCIGWVLGGFWLVQRDIFTPIQPTTTHLAPFPTLVRGRAGAPTRSHKADKAPLQSKADKACIHWRSSS